MVTASIVLYNEDLDLLRKTISSFLKIPQEKKLYLIDNSKQSGIQKYFTQSEIEYIFVGENIGFGKAHNLILDKITSNYHLILNPDVKFNSDVITILIEKHSEFKDVSFITPKVIYPNAEKQYVCRKNPTLYDLLNRKLKFSKIALENKEYRNLDLNMPFSPEFIHGCFMFFKTEDFKKLRGFDERFFLYMEDADICREIYKRNKKILYFPGVEIIHQHQRGSRKNLKLFFYHITSAFKYFLKWGL